MKKKINLLIFSVIVLTLLISSSLFSQAGRGKGRIYGIVKDKEGKPIEGAKITATYLKSTIVKRIVTSDKKGKWSIIGMGSGNWSFLIEAKGYKPVEVVRNIKQLSLNKPILVNLEKSEAAKIEKGNKEFVAKIQEADSLLKEKKYEEALKIYLELYKNNPQIDTLLYNIGNCYKFSGDYDNALKYFNELLQKEEKKEKKNEKVYIETLIAIGDTYLKQNKFEDAKVYFEKAFRMKPKDEILAYDLAEIYFNNIKMKEAISYYKKALEIKPEWHELYIKIGYAYINLGNYKMAKEYLNKYLKLEPNSQQAATIKQVLKSLENVK